MPQVSVVVPIYNKALHLEECLDSLLRQSLADIEILCVDDCSTDGSYDIVQRYAAMDRRVIALRQGANTGPGPARNAGIRQASGSFMQFTDADDVVPERALEMLRALAVEDDVPLVRGTLGSFVGTVDSGWIDDTHKMPDRRRLPLSGHRNLWLPYFHVCYLYSRQFLLDKHIFYPDLRSGEDPVFLAQCLVAAPFISTTSDVCYWYRQSELSLPSRSSTAHVVDFLHHMKVIKNLYLTTGHELCWRERCERFYLEDARLHIGLIPRDADDQAKLEAIVAEIWSDAQRRAD